jgi:hypothetical protein
MLNLTSASNIADYLPLLNGAIITDLIVIGRVIFGLIKSKSLIDWYNLYGLSGVLADVLSIMIGIIIAAFIYPFIFKKYSLLNFIIIAVIVQVCHDLLFATFFRSVPRSKSRILDTFKDYANEVGFKILIADALMIITTILLATLFTKLSTNVNIIILIVSLYMVPYFLYSIPRS